MKKLNLKLLKQIGLNNCWAACLSMALQVFGIKESEGELDKKFKGKNKGMNLDEIKNQFQNVFPNMDTDYRSEIFTGVSPILRFKEIKKSIDNGNPVMIGVNEFNGLRAHALLIFGYNEKKQTVLIADPWTGDIIEFTYGDLNKLNWSETLIIKKK